MLSGDLAKERSWANEYDDAFASGVVFIPPGAEDYILAGNIDFEVGQQNWEIALVKQSSGVMSPAVAAKQLGGKVESVAGLKSLPLIGNSHLVGSSKPRLQPKTKSRRT